ncbi:MAG: hypothetical protein ACW99A_03420 [Candidatus Kariarchaeaceae archaeon]|jgi:hypothetical protein
MTKEYLERLKQEYLRRKMFASGLDEEERKEIFALRSKINILKSTLHPWK